MSSYASFYINGQELLHWRNGLSSLVTSLFTKNDIIRGRGRNGLKLIKKYNLSYDNEYSEDDIDWEIVLAVIDIATLKKRLSIYGI